MILQSLVGYYEQMEKKGLISKEGWCRAKISFALLINVSGELVNIIPLTQSEERGKKLVSVPQRLEVPAQISRASGVSPNFICDNANYILGLDSSGKLKRTLECFEACKNHHLNILSKTYSPVANAIKLFFQKWKPEEVESNQILHPYLEELKKGGNIVFYYEGEIYAHEDSSVCSAWKEYFFKEEGALKGRCLVTGKNMTIARTHRVIKGIRDAQSSGALLVSFNAPSFESYEKTQSFNAPVSKYAAFAYSTALNDLIADKKHTFVIGNTTVIISVVPFSADMLPPVVDIEFYGKNEKNKPDVLAIRRELDVLLTELEDYYGQKPIIYTTMKAYLIYIDDYYDDYPLWIRNTHYRPFLFKDRDWLFWQFSDQEVLDGYSGEEPCIDMNTFNGTLKEFNELFVGQEKLE